MAPLRRTIAAQTRNAYAPQPNPSRTNKSVSPPSATERTKADTQVRTERHGTRHPDAQGRIP